MLALTQAPKKKGRHGNSMTNHEYIRRKNYEDRLNWSNIAWTIFITLALLALATAIYQGV